MSGAGATTSTARTLAFDGRGYMPVDAPAGDPLVADSWLVTDGGVVGWSMHVDRFVASVARQGGDDDLARRAAAAVPAAMPAVGDWFPAWTGRDPRRTTGPCSTCAPPRRCGVVRACAPLPMTRARRPA